MKIISFDMEDWFHILEADSSSSIKSWTEFDSRFPHSADRLLQILEEAQIERATFFFLGWIAEKHPDIVREISSLGHQIACHSYSHSLVRSQSKTEFSEDLARALGILTNLTGEKVDTYRAPGFSITTETAWAFNVLAEQGVTTDCSIFCGSHAHGGFPALKSGGPFMIESQSGCTLYELPVVPGNFLGITLIYSGGGYFRLLPYRVLDRLMRQNDYVMTYFHPRDFDPNQPMLDGLSYRRRFKSYVGLKTAEAKLRKVLARHEFMSVDQAVSQIDWPERPKQVF